MTASAPPAYEPPAIDARAAIDLPLLGNASGPVPSAVFRSA